MGMEQERKGGGGERLWRRPGLRRLRLAASGGAHRPERMQPLQGNGDVVAGVCPCGNASRLALSRWFPP